MFKPSGSWVAIPTPFDSNNKIDLGAFKEIVDFHIAHGTNMLFCMGSAGEVSLLTAEERYATLPEVVKMCKGRIPVFFGSTFPTTEATIKFAQYAEAQGADGLVFTAPNYVLPPQSAVKAFFMEAMQSVSIPVGVYNNPSRTGVFLEPETLEALADACPNFVVDKEAMPNVSQLCEVQMRIGDRVNIMCCDFPKYSILLPTMAVGGTGAANIGGNVIPEEMALMSKPWDNIEQVNICRETYFKFYPLLKALYWFSNPICIKAALNLMGLPGGHLRKPYEDLGGKKLEELKAIMTDLGVLEKYGRK
jgi:4-hydroxy-tetrahydrodipicolinate synthase